MRIRAQAITPLDNYDNYFRCYNFESLYVILLTEQFVELPPYRMAHWSLIEYASPNVIFASNAAKSNDESCVSKQLEDLFG